LDLLASSVMPQCDELFEILGCQVRSQPAYCRYMQLARSKGPQKCGKPSHRTRRANPLEGRGLGEMKHLDAIAEHGRAALAQVQPTLIHLAYIFEHLGLEYPTTPN
jgi:hypothetical protein